MSRRRSPTPNPSEPKYTEAKLKGTIVSDLITICREVGIDDKDIPVSRMRQPYIDLILGKNTGLESVHTTAGMSMLKSARQSHPISSGSAAFDGEGAEAMGMTHSKVRSAQPSPPPGSSSSPVRDDVAGSHDLEKDYPDSIPSPRGPQDDLRAQISEKVAKWFTKDYLDIFISHFRRNTDIAREKRSLWLKAISDGNRPFAGHPINLESNPTASSPDIKYLSYFNYADYPQLGVSDAEMQRLNSARDTLRRPRMVVMIGGASVGKSFNKTNFSTIATDLDVDEPVNLANAMVQLMPEKEDMWGKGGGIQQRYIIYAVIDQLISNRDDIIIDTTGGSKIAIHTAMNKAIAAGYEIVCVAVWSKLTIASSRCDARTATTLRTMNGRGVFFTFKSAREGMFIHHYAIKPRFRRKIDLFFLLDNSEVPNEQELDHAKKQTAALQSMIGTGIVIPANTVLILKNSVVSGTLNTKLIYKTPRSPAEILENNFYGCRIHLPQTIKPEVNLTDEQLQSLMRCKSHLDSGEKDGGRRTRKIIKIRSTRRRYKYKSNHRSKKHIKNSRRRRY